MKLYTEEQLHNTVIAVSNYLDDINLGKAQQNIEKHLKALQPIELPSDEEMVSIKNVFEFAEWMSSLINSNYKSGGNWYYNQQVYTTKQLYEKWLRDKIEVNK